MKHRNFVTKRNSIRQKSVFKVRQTYLTSGHQLSVTDVFKENYISEFKKKPKTLKKYIFSESMASVVRIIDTYHITVVKKSTCLGKNSEQSSKGTSG